MAKNLGYRIGRSFLVKVKQRRARLVLGWVTVWEYRVPQESKVSTWDFGVQVGHRIFMQTTDQYEVSNLTF